MPAIRSMVDLGWGDPGEQGTAAAGRFRRANVVALDVHGTRVWIHRELKVIFGVLLLELDSMLKLYGGGLDLDDRKDDWGYANRDIRGYPGRKSYHAWAAAVDVNATENVLGRRTTTFPVARTRALARKLGLRWGYDYAGRPDSMHFEFTGSVDDARRITAALLAFQEDLVTPEQIQQIVDDVTAAVAGTVAQYLKDVEERLQDRLRKSDRRVIAHIDKRCGPAA